MNRTIINVPLGITKLSQWTNFEEYLPQGKFILNKKITGCGATTYYLENPAPVILCSHRMELLECKAKSPRHVGRVHLFKTSEDTTKEDLEKNLASLRSYLDSCLPDPFGGPGTAPKILVTTDSLGHVVNVLNDYDLLKEFTVVSDECQCIFTDASFKGGSVLGYLGFLEYIPRVVFLSATPYLENYLDQIDYFKDLPYIELEWPAEMVEEVHLTPYYVKSLKRALNEKIGFWKANGYFEESGAGKATEAVFFVNSVATIISVIEGNSLPEESFNIICSHSNRKTIKKVKNAGYKVGSAPKEGEPHKPITFVTKCAFEGVDFYNTDAYTYVFSNPNLLNLSVDLSIDLVQILGRQRLDVNQWRNYATIYFGCTKSSFRITQEEFLKNVSEKEEFTQDAINKINMSAGHVKEKWIKTFESSHSKDGYIREYVDVLTNPITGTVTAYSNSLVKIAEARAWDIRNNIYNSRYQILRNLQGLGFKEDSVVLNNLNQYFLDHKDFIDRMKEYCNVMVNSSEEVQKEILRSVVIPKKYHEYYYAIGPERLRAQSYEESKILVEINNTSSINTIRDSVLKVFDGIQRIPKAEAKSKLQKIYDDLGLKKKAKASDLGEFYNISETLMDVNGKKASSVKLLSIK